MKLPLYKMRIVFTADMSLKKINDLNIDGQGTHPVVKNAREFVLEQTIPFVPTQEHLHKYEKAIKDNWKNREIILEDIRFTRYDYIVPIDSDIETMGLDRAKQLLFQTLQLIRQYMEKEGKDPVDTDDILFSELDMEIQELEEVYAPYPNITVYGSSCFETGTSPKDYDRKYFS